jgi:predicted ribosome quality control (RQC) complex YloA/Tae2 family protein
MISNYFTLQALTREAAPLIDGAAIRVVFSQEKDELGIVFEGDTPGLIFSCRPDESVFYLHPALARAKRNSADLFQGAWGHHVRSLSLDPADRVVSLHLDDGRSIDGLMFGTAANVLLLEPDRTIERAFRNDRTLRGTIFQARQGEAVYDFALLLELPATQPQAPAASAVRRLYPPLGATLTEEAFFRAGLSPAALAGTLEGNALERLAASLQTMLIEAQHPAPRVYESPDGRPVAFSIVPLRHMMRLAERLFTRTHEAVRFFVARERATSALKDRKLAAVTRLRQQLERIQRTLDAVRTEAVGASRVLEYEQNGMALMANLQDLHQGDDEAHIVLESSPLRIKLDPRLSPVKNAQRYFEKAKRARSAAVQTAERIQELEGQLLSGHALLGIVEEVTSTEDLRKVMKDQAGSLAAFGIGAKGQPEQFPFRRFVVDGGFEVWAGKSSRNNDELTLHHAKPNDLWFHARGASGSHVILRTGSGSGEPGKKAKEQAAAIAAYYSKMRTSGLVPVAMTERRYVRKPKGSEPGSVTLERERVIFVKPQLPAAHADKS